MRSARITAAAVGLILGIISILFVAPAPPSQAQFEDLIARVKPAVVLVNVSTVLGGSGHGSGFIFDSSGYVLTNHHVVEGAVEISVVLPDRRTFRATVVDYIRRHDWACPSGLVQTWTDAAVLKIDGAGLPTIPMGDSDSVRQGQEVLVMGYPGGLSTEEVSVSRGIVGAVRAGWFQTDATIVPGNSGGPVVDRQGRVVGLASFIVGPTAQTMRIGGVVSINAIRSMADAATRPGTSRVQEFKITGLEYVPQVAVGRRRVFRKSYDPGSAGGQPFVREWNTEVTRVQNFSGSFAYSIRGSDGSETTNFLDADGLHAISASAEGWRIEHAWPAYLFNFPPCVGYEWRRSWRAENASQGIARQVIVNVRIQSANETVSVPAGNFAQVIATVETLQGTDVRVGQSRQWRETITTWWAPGVGVVREVEENPDTRQRWVDDLVSTETSPPAASPPVSPPTPPSAPPTEPPSATPPPEVSRPPAPNDRAIVPGERVGFARVGDSLDDVIRIVGEVPTSTGSQQPGQPSGWIRYQWKNRVYVLADKEKRVIMEAGVWASNPSEVPQPPFRTPAGIGLSSSEFEVRAAYGLPSKREPGQNNVLLIYNSAGIAFWVGTSPQFFFNGQVYDISTFKPGSHP